MHFCGTHITVILVTEYPILRLNTISVSVWCVQFEGALARNACSLCFCGRRYLQSMVRQPPGDRYQFASDATLIDSNRPQMPTDSVLSTLFKIPHRSSFGIHPNSGWSVGSFQLLLLLCFVVFNTFMALCGTVRQFACLDVALAFNWSDRYDRSHLHYSLLFTHLYIVQLFYLTICLMSVVALKKTVFTIFFPSSFWLLVIELFKSQLLVSKSCVACMQLHE